MHRALIASIPLVLSAFLVSVFAPSAQAHPEDDGHATMLTIYCGRSESLVGPVLERFERESGVHIQVRYGGTAQLAGLLLEEGSKTPADVFFAQDAGALGALAKADRLNPLPDSILDRVDEKYRSPDGVWVGVTGRARTIVYNTDRLSVSELPESIMDFTDPKWKGKIGWAPGNGSFQAAITAMRAQLGDDATRAWLKGIIANEPKEYPKNSAIVRAVGDGEVTLGFVNHYYLYRFTSKNPSFPAANGYTKAGDPGSLVNVAGVGLLKKSKHDRTVHQAAIKLAEFLLSETGQAYFATETNEYPLIDEVPAPTNLRPLSEIEPPAIDLSDLDDLQGTLKMLKEVGALP